MKCIRIPMLLAAVLGIAACTTGPSWDCGPSEESEIVDSMYFGTSMPGGTVSLEDWKGFVDGVVTPRFPQGLTWWKASGQWQGAKGQIGKEECYVLQIVHAATEESEVAVREIIKAYKTRFHQEAVLRTRHGACASF
jgi:hypothetical protein